MRRANTSGPREGRCEVGTRKAEGGTAGASPFRVPTSAFRVTYPAATAPATVKNSRRSIVLAPLGFRAILRGLYAIRNPPRAARRQTPESELPLGSRDRHPDGRLQGWP